MRKSHNTYSDLEFELKFKNGELLPSDFIHEAHLRLVWIHINHYGIEKALQNIPTQLQNFVISAGAANKYNLTLTVAAIKAVYHFILKSNTDNFVSLIEENRRLKSNFKELLSGHYEFDIYNSVHAKQSYLAPDLLPFD
jgi:hypothetical protein